MSTTITITRGSTGRRDAVEVAARAGSRRMSEAHTAADQADRDRITAIFDAHHDRLFRLALRLLGERQAALDLVQDTFVRALGHLESVPSDEAAAGAWLSKVALNLARDRWRRRAVRRRWMQESGRICGPEPRPDDSAADRVAVRAALGQLTPRQRAVVLMAEIEGMDSREIGDRLGLRPVTVRWHLAVARRRLRHRLAPRQPATNDGGTDGERS